MSWVISYLTLSFLNLVHIDQNRCSHFRPSLLLLMETRLMSQDNEMSVCLSLFFCVSTWRYPIPTSRLFDLKFGKRNIESFSGWLERELPNRQLLRQISKRGTKSYAVPWSRAKIKVCYIFFRNEKPNTTISAFLTAKTGKCFLHKTVYS